MWNKITKILKQRIAIQGKTKKKNKSVFKKDVPPRSFINKMCKHQANTFMIERKKPWRSLRQQEWSKENTAGESKAKMFWQDKQEWPNIEAVRSTKDPSHKLPLQV